MKTRQEIEKELKRMVESWTSIDGILDYILNVQEGAVTEKDAQIEKMKCCGNCKHSKYGYVCFNEESDCNIYLNKWEMK